MACRFSSLVRSINTTVHRYSWSLGADHFCQLCRGGLRLQSYPSSLKYTLSLLRDVPSSSDALTASSSPTVGQIGDTDTISLSNFSTIARALKSSSTSLDSNNTSSSVGNNTSLSFTQQHQQRAQTTRISTALSHTPCLSSSRSRRLQQLCCRQGQIVIVIFTIPQ